MIEVQAIDYISRVGDHSSIYSDGVKTFKVRNSDDKVGGFYRCEIDRSGDLMLRQMRDENNDPILLSTIQKAREQGEIAILDAGCGTGRTLYEIRDQLLFRTGISPEKIVTVGVNIEDFSDESEEVAPREAISKGDVRYVVADLETVELPENAFDLITSFETLTHNKGDKIASIIRNLIKSLKSGGLLFFNIHPSQRTDPRISSLLEEELSDQGLIVSDYSIVADWGMVERVFIRIRKPEE